MAFQDHQHGHQILQKQVLCPVVLSHTFESFSLQRWLAGNHGTLWVAQRSAWQGTSRFLRGKMGFRIDFNVQMWKDRIRKWDNLFYVMRSRNTILVLVPFRFVLPVPQCHPMPHCLTVARIKASSKSTKSYDFWLFVQQESISRTRFIQIPVSLYRQCYMRWVYVSWSSQAAVLPLTAEGLVSFQGVYFTSHCWEKAD